MLGKCFPTLDLGLLLWYDGMGQVTGCEFLGDVMDFGVVCKF